MINAHMFFYVLPAAVIGFAAGIGMFKGYRKSKLRVPRAALTFCVAWICATVLHAIVSQSPALVRVLEFFSGTTTLSLLLSAIVTCGLLILMHKPATESAAP